MITYIKINGFKSFHNFEMEFTPLTVIAGANASGKSNLFDALMLLSRLAEVDIRTAFSEQRGNALELFTKYDEDTYANEMEFTVEMLVNRIIKDNWGGEVELNNTRLRYNILITRKQNSIGFEGLYIKNESLEKIPEKDDKWLKQFKEARELSKTLRAGGSKDSFIKTEDEGNRIAIKMRQDGKAGRKTTPADTISQTVLGGVNSVDFPHVFAAKEEMRSWKYLQLIPEHLREPTKQEPGIKDAITSSGKNLASALYRIKQTDEYNLREISRDLNKFIPEFSEVNVIDDKANQQFIIKLKGEDSREFSSSVLSEGTLRLLALCILLYDDKHTGLLCFEEPENGIHPFRIKAMAKLLKELSSDFNDDNIPLRQVIVNTHSALLVNEMVNWKNNKNVSVNYSQKSTLIKNISNKRFKFDYTKIIPVSKESGYQPSIFISEQDRKYTLLKVDELLHSAENKYTDEM